MLGSNHAIFLYNRGGVPDKWHRGLSPSPPSATTSLLFKDSTDEEELALQSLEILIT